MDEMQSILPPGLNSALEACYAAPQPEPTFADYLEAQLRQRQIELIGAAASKQKSHSLLSNTRSSFMHMLRTRPLLALIAAILALILLTGVAYAVGRLTGFIPGIGFVNNVQSVLETPVRVSREIVLTPTSDTSSKAGSPQGTQLPPSASSDEPKAGISSTAVSIQEQKGITITVEQVVAEAERLVINYKITGLPVNLFGSERVPTLQAFAEAHPDEQMPEQVRLADGTLLKHGDGGTCTGGGDLATSWLSCRIVFSPLPDAVNQFTLEIHRLQNVLPGELPEDWVIPIHLTPVSSPQAAGGGIQQPDLRSQSVQGITLRLDKVVQSPAQTAFQLAMEWEGANRMIHHTAPTTLQDAQGRYYILTGGPDGGRYTIDKPNFATLPSLVTSPLDGSSPLTLRVEWIVMSASTQDSGAENSAAILKFDPGSAARVGQEWPLDQTFQAGDFDVRFTKARLLTGQDGAFTLEFDILAPPVVNMINLFPNDINSSSTESGYDMARGVLVSRVALPALPTQPVELYVSEVIYKVSGPWEITWQPQKMNGTIAIPTPAPTRMVAPAPGLLTSDPLLTEAQALMDKASVPNGPGWVHQVIQMDQTAPIGILDTGDQPEQPLQMKVDIWHLLDQQGFARTTIVIRKALDGKFVSADVDSGVYHFSFPEGRGGIGPDIFIAKPSFYYDPLTTINSYVAEGGKVSQENSTVDGKPCRLYTGTNSIDPPITYWGEPAPVRGMIYSACIDPASGAVLQIQDQMVYSDGTSRVRSTTRFISLEKVEALPDEARQLLEKIIMP